ncbi:hypothetical protein HY469_04035 [Candidatus Roizmanbacteria bacterium]|nr:hypothetical protein [Candidatus Roizmanbacteria bacterium]
MRPEYTGHFLRIQQSDIQHSFPVYKKEEGLYQVLQLIFQKNNGVTPYDIYAVLEDSDPARTLEFFGLDYPGESKELYPEGLTRMKDAYAAGKDMAVPASAEHLVFPVADIRSQSSILRFVAQAYARQLHLGRSGEVNQVVLDGFNPYSLFYFVISSENPDAVPSLESMVQTRLQVAPQVLADTPPFKVASRFNDQLLDCIRSYMLSSRASTGNLPGLSSIT